MRAELKRRDDAEVPAAAAQRPEQLGICVLTGGDDLARREHHLGGQQVVDGHAEPAHEPAEPPAQRQAGDPGARDHAAGRRKPESGGRAVKLGYQDTRLRPHRLANRIHVDPFHPRQVDHQPAVGDRLAGDVVPAAPDRDLERLVAAEVDGVDDVRRVQATRDQARALVDEAVVDAPCVVVSRIVRREDLAGEHGSESFGGWGVEVEHAATLPPHRGRGNPGNHYGLGSGSAVMAACRASPVRERRPSLRYTRER